MILGGAGDLAAERSRWSANDGIGDAEAAAVVRLWAIPTLDREERLATDAGTGSWLVVSGHLFADRTAADGRIRGGIASTLLTRLMERGPGAIDAFDGTFALAWWDARGHRLHLMRDAFGIEPLFYAEHAGSVAFASRIRDLALLGVPAGGIAPRGLVEFLVWGYTPSDATLASNVRKVPPGSRVTVDPERGVVERARWYRLSFADPVPGDERAIRQRFRDLLERAVTRRAGPSPAGALLSGGMDSSSVVTLMRRHDEGPIRTFAFRCAGGSFDESFYARALAAELGTDHTEVDYGESEALLEEEAVREMDVPFCDIGIVGASWILGAAAEGLVRHVLTGDGGDELWGSHPVYAAQRILAVYERLGLPRALTRALGRLAARLGDSPRKRDLRVKLKRILPPDSLPRELGPFRWRASFSPDDLAAALTPEARDLVRGSDPLRAVLDAYDGYDGPDDGLSRFLHNDYVTSSSFYFSRLLLLRRFGVEARCPFYDRDLVEYGARIPARLKLEGIERTKRLFRESMDGVLPEVVRSRKDKLGHSVPLKNWLRGEGPLAARIADVLAPAAVARRGLFRPAAVARMIDEHRALRHNHSHRIWSLYVLEAWFRSREA